MVLWCIKNNNKRLFLSVFACLAIASISACGADDSLLDGSLDPTLENVEAPTEIFLRDLAFATLAPPTIEVIQQTPTPLPTATATPTATPIVYVIEAGDTLLGVAIDNQTTVEEIQSLNPNVRPELLSIGQEIALPPPATPVFGNDRPTPLPIQIQVGSASLFPDGAGGLWVVGEVENSADYFLENLRLEIILYGEGGLVVGRMETWTASELIAPNSTSVFGLFFPQKPEGNLQVEIQAIRGFTFAQLPEDDSRYFGLTADEPQLDFDQEAFAISGNIANVGNQIATDIILLVATYDFDGRLTGFAQFSPFETLAIGEEASYTYALVPPGGLADQVKVQVSARK